MIAIALAAPWRWAISRANVRYLVAPLVLTALLLFPVYGERSSYLELNSRLLSENKQVMASEDRDLRALYETLAELPPGRVYAGLQNNWGGDYLVGSVPVYALLIAEGMDMLSFYPHAHSLNSAGLVLFDEKRWEHYNIYNIRYVVAPEGRTLPGFASPIRKFGRHRLYQVETTGYFDLVGADQSFAGDRSGFFEGVSSWLASDQSSVKQHPVVSIGGSGTTKGRAAPLPLAQSWDLIREFEISSGPSHCGRSGSRRQCFGGGRIRGARKPAAFESHLSSQLAGHRRWSRDAYGHADAQFYRDSTTCRRPPSAARI